MGVLMRVGWVSTWLTVAGVIGCATAASPAEPDRPTEIPGLAPIPAPPAASSPAAPSSSLGETTDPPSQAAATEIIRLSPEQGQRKACPARIGPGSVRRSALSHTLDAGLGSWLRGVDVEPRIDHGRFQGWLVRGIYAGDPCWADVDLRPGDVVSRINRRPIERPEQAQIVWTALRSTGEIVVEFLRAGQTMTLRFPIVDDEE